MSISTFETSSDLCLVSVVVVEVVAGLIVVMLFFSLVCVDSQK